MQSNPLKRGLPFVKSQYKGVRLSKRSPCLSVNAVCICIHLRNLCQFWSSGITKVCFLKSPTVLYLAISCKYLSPSHFSMSLYTSTTFVTRFSRKNNALVFISSSRNWVALSKKRNKDFLMYYMYMHFLMN